MDESNLHQSNVSVAAHNATHNMTNIEEVSKCEEMSISPIPTPENQRICLVGTVVDDKVTVVAAQSFGVPVVTSETGSEFVGDNDWITYFIMNDFEGPMYEAIHKSKHRIMGPPALQQAVQMKEGLVVSNRPIYSYAMRGVITCFTGIRKKDELTRLVNLIHAMGGSIRKDMNSKVTHLICNTSGGEKYQYAMTFRLAVVRSAWVYDAWEHRNNFNFNATNDEFSRAHKLKAFEGQKVCFFGFASDEHQHMVDVLKSNGGVPTDLEDPDCSHVVMSNMGAHFPENICPTSPNPSEKIKIDNAENELPSNNDHNVGGVVVKNTKIVEVTNTVVCEHEDDVDSTEMEKNFPCSMTEACFMSQAENENNFNVMQDNSTNLMLPENIPGPISTSSPTSMFSTGCNIDNSTPKSSKSAGIENTNDIVKQCSTKQIDGIVLTSSNESEFINPNNISPILKTKSIEDSFLSLQPIDEEEDDLMKDKTKRKRDSIDDDISLVSTDSFAPVVNSAKKPKLIRTGSITRGLRRSMSFVAIKTPIANMLRSRRNSVDPNASINSITSIETTFNESIKKPVKEKLRGIRDRITKTCKRDINMTPKSANFATLKRICKLKNKHQLDDNDVISTPEFKTIEESEVVDQSFSGGFKTPVAPLKSYNTRHSVCGTPTAISDYEREIVRKRLSVVAATAAISTTMTATSTITTADENLPIVDEHTVQAKPEPKNAKTHIVKADWFWYTIQNGYADETDYLFGDYLDSIANTPGGDRRDSLPISFNKRKRKRLSQRTIPEGTPIGTGKRRSSVSDAGLLSVSGSFLDCTTSPDKHEGSKHITDTEAVIDVQPSKSKSMRYNHFVDLFQTESNYVGILDTIVSLFKEPLEKMADTHPNDALLNKSEVKAIFSNFLPIYEVHKKMLNSFKELQTNWNEDYSIGKIILDNRNDLIKAYPPYVNFFEQMKEALLQCDTQKPRFHAFLKINQAKPECGRQSLQDLMIRPVQRLPSISLLINDILKHTPKSSPDSKKLEEALKAIKEVMTYINEDKRKTEGQLAMFDIFNDIENCPPHLVSSHRSFVSKCEVTELSDQLSGRGDSLMLFLFNDNMEVCKKRSRGFNSAKSPSTTINGLNSTRVTTTKPYKHIKLMPLSSIRLVIDIRDSPRAFALNCRLNKENKDKIYYFSICEEEVDKIIYLRSLCKQMAENACRADAEKFLISVDSQELDIDISDLNVGTLSKAFKFATRTRLKVGRAFSFNKTPSKLKRAVSTMMTSPFGSTNSLTPASQLAQMKLASCTNINEIGEEDEESPTKEVLVAPMSVQPTRKAKNPISIAALRRL